MYNSEFEPIRSAVYKLFSDFFEFIAKFFGYPGNPGIPTISESLLKTSAYRLKERSTYFPPAQFPESWMEVIFGPPPRIDELERFFYQTDEEGFYNFYVPNYSNIFFMPDWLSEFLQIKLNFCLDISTLEVAREVAFVGLLFYCQLVILRVTISWFSFVNPYSQPWRYLTTAVDWIEDSLHGVVPTVFAVNVTGSVFLGALGWMADSLNNLVFTMPFLPSEGEQVKLLINGKTQDVIVFHYLPILWYRHPIPNDLREFWFTERPDILEYMQTAYANLDLHLFPDYIANYSFTPL